MHEAELQADVLVGARMIYNRQESPTQTRADARAQVKSGEVWGRAPRGGAFLCVKAYRNRLPKKVRGIEFTSSVAPERGSGTPYEARWYHPDTPGVLGRTKNGEDFAAIPADVTNKQP
jgi:hypothetical protein